MTGQKPEKTNPTQSAKTPEPDILPPKEDEQTGNITIQTIIQNIDRPEELFKVFEEHSPGFIESTRKQVEMFFEKSMEIRFKFGERQAYTTLFLRVLLLSLFSCLQGSLYSKVQIFSFYLPLLYSMLLHKAGHRHGGKLVKQFLNVFLGNNIKKAGVLLPPLESDFRIWRASC